MTTDKITDEKLQFNINREAVNISELSSDKIDEYKYFTGEEILLFDQSRMIEEAKLNYSPFGKPFKK